MGGGAVLEVGGVKVQKLYIRTDPPFYFDADRDPESALNFFLRFTDFLNKEEFSK